MLKIGDSVRLRHVPSNLQRFPRRVGSIGTIAAVPRSNSRGDHAQQWEVLFEDGKQLKFKRSTLELVKPLKESRPIATSRSRRDITATKQKTVSGGDSDTQSISKETSRRDSEADLSGTGDTVAGNVEGPSLETGKSLETTINSQKGRLVSQIPPDLWESLTVKILHGKGEGEFADVRSTGNGWIQVDTRRTSKEKGISIAKRSHELMVEGLKENLKRNSQSSPESRNLVQEVNASTGSGRLLRSRLRANRSIADQNMCIQTEQVEESGKERSNSREIITPAGQTAKGVEAKGNYADEPANVTKSLHNDSRVADNVKGTRHSIRTRTAAAAVPSTTTDAISHSSVPPSKKRAVKPEDESDTPALIQKVQKEDVTSEKTKRRTNASKTAPVIEHSRDGPPKGSTRSGLQRRSIATVKSASGANREGTRASNKRRNASRNGTSDQRHSNSSKTNNSDSVPSFEKNSLMTNRRHSVSNAGMSVASARKAEDEARQARTRFYIQKQRATLLTNRPDYARWLQAVAFDEAALNLSIERNKPRKIVPDGRCKQCNFSKDVDEEYCWNLQCPACPAYQEPWEHYAAIQRAVVAGHSAKSVKIGPHYEYTYRRSARTKYVGRPAVRARQVQNVILIGQDGTERYVPERKRQLFFGQIPFLPDDEFIASDSDNEFSNPSGEKNKNARLSGTQLQMRWGKWIQDEIHQTERSAKQNLTSKLPANNKKTSNKKKGGKDGKTLKVVKGSKRVKANKVQKGSKTSKAPKTSKPSKTQKKNKTSKVQSSSKGTKGTTNEAKSGKGSKTHKNSKSSKALKDHKNSTKGKSKDNVEQSPPSGASDGVKQLQQRIYKSVKENSGCILFQFQSPNKSEDIVMFSFVEKVEHDKSHAKIR